MASSIFLGSEVLGVHMETARISSPGASTVTKPQKSECMFIYSKTKASTLTHSIINLLIPQKESQL